MSEENTSADDVKSDDDTKAGGIESSTGDEGKSGDAGKRTYTPEEYEALYRRMQAADRTVSKLQEERQAAEDAKKDELTRAKDALTKAQAEIAELKQNNKSTLLKAEFGLAGVQWHNPATAYATLLNEYPDIVSVEEDGKVTGMKAAVDKLVKEHSYLVKSTDGKKDEENSQASAATGPVKNGARKGGTGDNAEAVKEAMRKRLPALAARVKK